MDDPRETRLPVWARDMLRRLRSDNSGMASELKSVNTENERLRVIIAGKFTGDTTSDTFLINDDTAERLPLGVGPTVQFGGFADVTLSGDAVFVETEGRIVIRPGGYDHQIVISQE